MPTTKWILPDGIEDILPEQAYWLEMKRREVIDAFISSGYGLVIPPLVEYTDSLMKDASEDLNLQTYKLVDQETGKQLGLRTDITSQISRIYSTYNDDSINRYCYFDHVVRTKNDNTKNSRIPIQAGAELIGNKEIEGDAELVILMLDVLKKFTEKKVFLDLGHVGIFKKLISNVNMEIDQEKIMKNLIRSKSISEIKEFLNETNIDPSLKKCLQNFPKMHGSIKEIEKYSDQLKSFNNDIESDICYMRNLADIVNKTHNNVSIQYDFCELKGFDYENDIIFSAYIENDSEEVAIGGKYDLDKGGASGIGFSIDVRYLLKNLFLNKTKNKLVNKSGKWVLENNEE
tara:strand:- start:3035 stop:4069 length:1035 start_codon:yes stop_codon:yes gene_type:complete